MSEPKVGVDPVADFKEAPSGQRFATVLADPPWQFINRTGKVAPEHCRLSRYETMGGGRHLPLAGSGARAGDGAPLPLGAKCSTAR